MKRVSIRLVSVAKLLRAKAGDRLSAMKKALLILSLTFIVGHADAQTAGVIEAHRKAMVASDECKKAWLQSTRKDALAVIEKRGTYIALSLDPLSASAERDGKLLEEVTNALRKCAELTFSD